MNHSIISLVNCEYLFLGNILIDSFQNVESTP